MLASAAVFVATVNTPRFGATLSNLAEAIPWVICVRVTAARVPAVSAAAGCLDFVAAGCAHPILANNSQAADQMRNETMTAGVSTAYGRIRN
jgi:hypothetical protein